MSREAIEKLSNMFENGRTHIDDAERDERPSTATNSKIVARLNECILANVYITIDEISNKMDISYGSVHKIIADYLEPHDDCLLTEEHKGKLVESAFAFLQCYQKEGNEFLSTIVTASET
ncbi:histone-lysine N-methyltransferase SETMAR [Nephila pilipes]|uniref:Histone-lysine N-methyltransferase SETMAR n=1 Tax=Nephila pilipes TaxID=299642 RepID=A0A8X6M8X1_NEPPI|nr:histone-lysine N-methyltransferase SETMAR [Nephila pilipes]GFU15772.1 histone-lysine N-methyltransferase SETMAR [Nephila pilipes]